MVQELRISCVLAFPDDMHPEDAISQARQAAESIGAATNLTIYPVSDKPTLDTVLNELGSFLIAAGFKDMGKIQTMPGSDEVVQRFLKGREELVDIVSTLDPDEETLEALLGDKIGVET
jgi:hypothetical protein